MLRDGLFEVWCDGVEVISGQVNGSVNAFATTLSAMYFISGVFLFIGLFNFFSLENRSLGLFLFGCSALYWVLALCAKKTRNPAFLLPSLIILLFIPSKLGLNRDAFNDLMAGIQAPKEGTFKKEPKK